ncbi:MAG TPA: rhodanese-like domain-containing protein [Clostridiales bacterium]|nr:rhodanese-like domain-containing protein [Clostridiales bacterium]
MKHRDTIWIITIAFLALAAAAGYTAWKYGREARNSAALEAGSGTYRTLSPGSAEKRLREEKDIILLDVRTPAENAEIRITGSLLLPLDRLEKEAASVLPSKDATIFIYCRSGNRSQQAANILLQLGYTRVYDIGGIIDWPYATETGS